MFKVKRRRRNRLGRQFDAGELQSRIRFWSLATSKPLSAGKPHLLAARATGLALRPCDYPTIEQGLNRNFIDLQASFSSPNKHSRIASWLTNSTRPPLLERQPCCVGHKTGTVFATADLLLFQVAAAPWSLTVVVQSSRFRPASWLWCSTNIGLRSLTNHRQLGTAYH
jgi:hypothetical protein